MSKNSNSQLIALILGLFNALVYVVIWVLRWILLLFIKEEPVTRSSGINSASRTGDIKCVSFTYRNAAGSESSREVDISSVDDGYFTGYCHLRGEVRTFRFDRIVSRDVVLTDTGEYLDTEYWIDCCHDQLQKSSPPVKREKVASEPIAKKESYIPQASVSSSRYSFAVPGVDYDDSYFIDPETGGFCFPKYKHLPEYAVKITDRTNYREEYWYALSRSEKESYSMRDFEADIYYPDIEVEDLSALFRAKNKECLGQYSFLSGRYEAFFDLYSSQKDGGSVSINNKAALNSFLKNGLLEVDDSVSVSERLSDLKVTELKDIARNMDITIGKKVKAELIDAIAESSPPAELLPNRYKASDALDQVIEDLSDIYIAEVEKNAERFHPAYLESIWDAVADSEFRVIKSKAIEKFGGLPD